MIFGATGDLANRKLFPLYIIYLAKEIYQKTFAVIGVARRSLSNDEFKENIKKSVETITDDQDKNE